MKGFILRGSDVVGAFDDLEVSLLISLVGQVNELPGADPELPEHADATGESDPFTLWEGSFGAGVALDDGDPVIGRLFPDAYSDDPVATAEHRRLTRDDQRRARVEDGAVVLAALEATDGGRAPVVIQPGRLDAWIKTLNGVRLALAVRLGIEAESDHDRLERLPVKDPRSQLVALYDWVGVVLESLLEAAEGLV